MFKKTSRIYLATALILLPFFMGVSSQLHAKANKQTQSLKKKISSKKVKLYTIKSEQIKGLTIEVYREVNGQVSKPLSLNKVVTLHVELLGTHASKYSLESFDARMPEHDHGMMTKALVTKSTSKDFTKKYLYLVEGVILHMNGEWVLYFILNDTKTGKKTVLSQKINLL